jgi:CheY-like chemotaxis protein
MDAPMLRSTPNESPPGTQQEPSPDAALSMDGPHVRRDRVLLVEDDADIREALVEVLRMEQWTVETAPNGQLALDRLRQAPSPDLMLLDLMMPVMDGFELLEQLRESPGPSTVVLSASREVERVRGHPLVRSVLGKPVDVGVLLAVLEGLRQAEVPLPAL